MQHLRKSVIIAIINCINERKERATMLTVRQKQTYQFIRQYILKHDIAPTEAEIAIGIGIKSRGVVHRYVKALATAGYLRIIPNRRRNIALIDNYEGDGGSGILSGNSLPIVGRIAAGKPIEALETDEVLNVAESLLGPNRYILEVKGDSMIGDGIHDGDYIICEKAETACDGTIVVALIDSEEATLKRLIRNNDNTIHLVASNPRITPMAYSPDRVKVQGIYLGLLRLGDMRWKLSGRAMIE